MAFDYSKLSRIGGMGDAQKVYAYASSDSIATVTGADYFLPAINELQVNDVIFVSDSDAAATCLERSNYFHFEKRANPINPMPVMIIPAIPTPLGSAAPKNTTSPARANTTSLHWVASTAASFAGVSAFPLAYKNREVATTPDNRATRAVFIHWPGEGLALLLAYLLFLYTRI